MSSTSNKESPCFFAAIVASDNNFLFSLFKLFIKHKYLSLLSVNLEYNLLLYLKLFTLKEFPYNSVKYL